jgi:RHS repeat-associated protein
LIQPYTYTGREYDPETGLYYYRARYYDPKIGRFLQEDPIWDVNLYGYVGNRPVNFTDPMGLYTWDEWVNIATSGLEGYAKGGQGIVNTFTGGLFDPKSGLFYNTFNNSWKGTGFSGIDCDKSFEFGTNAGRVAESLLLAAGVLRVYEGITNFRIAVHGTHGENRGRVTLGHSA